MMGSCAQCLSNPFALSFFFLTYISDDPFTPLNTCRSLACSPREGCMGRGGAPCPCWTLTTVRPLPPHPTQCMSKHGMCVHCLLPSLHGLCVHVWGLNLQPLSNPVVLSVHVFALLLCERRQSKNLTIWRGLEDWFENHCFNLFVVYFLLFLQLTCFLY